MYTNVPVEALTDSYKIGMSQLHSLKVLGSVVDIAGSYSNFTPRKNAYMDFCALTDGHIVPYGTRATFQAVVQMWDSTFFMVDRAKVLNRTKRRLMANFGSIKDHHKFLEDLGKLHDLGYLPLEVRAVDEGTRYPLGLPLFTVKSTVDGYGWLVNFIETMTSGLIWPMTNTATKVEQFYLQAKHYGDISAPKEVVDMWLPICVHEFGMRGYRGTQDQIHTSSAHSLFFLGSDTIGVIDFFEDQYDANCDEEPIAVSVRASEHADISRMLSLFRHIAKKAQDDNDGHPVNLDVEGRKVRSDLLLDNTERYVLEYFVKNSTGIMSYVADTEDYYRLLNVYAKFLCEDIKNRSPREDGQPAILVFRPDSSRHAPLNVICGYQIFKHLMDYTTGDVVTYEHEYDKHIVIVNGSGEHFLATKVGESYVLGEEISKEEAEGSLISLWNTFGGTVVDTESGSMKLIDPSVGLLYGEAISQVHQKEIYECMIEMGFSS